MRKMTLMRSSGNVFRDLGFSPAEAEHLKVRADLMLSLQKEIVGRRLKQGEVAQLWGVTQPRVSDLMRGRVDLFSIDTLIDMLAKLGVRTKVDWPRVLKPSSAKESISLRVDPEVVGWFRAQGPGWQTRMNAALKAYKEAASRPRGLTSRSSGRS